MALIDIEGGVPATTLSGGITSGATSISVTDGSGYPTGAGGNFYIVIDLGLSSEEVVECSARSGNTLTAATRGADGTSAAAHDSGAAIAHVAPASALQEANTHANQTTGTPHGSAYLTASDNAATATALETARTIGGVSFDGTANINLPGVNQAGTQDTSGNAATATLATSATSAVSATSATTATTATNLSDWTSVVQVQELIASTSSTVLLKTAGATIGSGTITLPSGWGSMRLVVQGHLLARAATTGNPRCDFDLTVDSVASDYGIHSFTSATADERELVPINSYIAAAATGSVSWSLSGTVTTGSDDDIDVRRRELHVVKYRLS